MNYIIDITDSKLHLLYWEHNGNIFDYDLESYWKIGNVYLHVFNYYSNRNYYTVVDKYFNTKSSNEYIFNVLYEKVDCIESSIRYLQGDKKVKEFRMELTSRMDEFYIKIIDKIPQKISSTNEFSENMTKCIMRQRNLTINNIIN